MGKKSELEGSDRRDVVLMLLRREEPAAVLAGGTESRSRRSIAGGMSSWPLAKRP